MYRDSVPGGWKIFLATLFAVVAAFTIMAGAGAGRADAAETITDYRYTSEPGDYIGSGGRGAFTSANSTISISGTNAYLTVNITNGNERWSVDLAAPRGEKLRPGKHYDAERAAFRTGLAPGLDVSGNGRGCNEVWGQFSIRQNSADSTGKVTMLEATFIQHCESARAPRAEGHGQVQRSASHLLLHQRRWRLDRGRYLQTVFWRHHDVLPPGRRHQR